MKILAIETSCDETAVSLIECTGALEHPRFRVLGDALQSQVELHKEYGGVYPNLAKREHSNNLVPLLKQCISEANDTKSETTRNPKQTLNSKEQNIQNILEREPTLREQFLSEVPQIEKPNVDYIAVTCGPGLEPALWVGINFARALSLVWDIPAVPVNHMEGHIASVLLDDTQVTFPTLSLLVSGGHTQLTLVHEWGVYETVGQTRDDAVGEAFDKVARILGLGYPGGPAISRAAAAHRTEHPEHEARWDMPRPMIGSDDLDFSFSGIKTAVLYRVHEAEELTPEMQAEIAREFEDAVLDVLVAKTKRALEKYGVHTLIAAGGVTANPELRRRLEELAPSYDDLALFTPRPELSTDNATMIAMAGYLRVLRAQDDFTVCPDITARGNDRIDY